MNKKFSTLLAGMMLATAFSANAALNTDIKLKEGANSGLYQLKAAGKFLSITENPTTKNDEIKLVGHSSANLGGTMWCVNINAENQGQNPKFDFTNKVGKFLGLDISTIAGKAAAENEEVNAVVGGELSGWKFSRVFKNGVESSALYSYFTNDSVIGLKVVNGDVKMVKVGADKIDANTFTEFELVEADELIIKNADDLNTIFGTQDKKAGIALKFTPDVLGDGAVNPFVEEKFTVEASADADYFHVLRADSSYLYVDTAYTNAVGGSKFLAYKWNALKDSYKKGTNLPTAKDSINATDLADQYKFKFTYHPTEDSLEIQVKEVTLKEDLNGDEVDYWNSTDAVKKSDYHISLQELLKDKVRILTVDEKQNTKISLGFAGCEAIATTKTTIADGVYLIKNAKTNKYLASPIHNNGTDAEWVTLDLQDANHMPAYQWVVLKRYAQDNAKVSPIEFINREFADVEGEIQLNKVATGEYMYASVADCGISTADSLVFIPVAKGIYTDKYLGYKNLTNDELITNKYTFNYWHPYASDKFIGIKDSTMNVLDGKSAFDITTNQTEYAYGYKPSTEVAGDGKKVAGRIPGLVQLVRKMYIISNNGNTFRNNEETVEDKYILSKYYANNKKDSVFFKENNCIEGVDYYAIVEVNEDADKIGTHKAGVSDYDASASLKAQVLNETRTSAFAIAPDFTPLYRHFNNVALGENANDEVDSLYFVEKIRGEYLMDEWNEKLQDKNVDYAGIWNKEKAEGKLAFIVDTAWVNRGSGLVKPQYLISVARNDQEGTPGVPCTYEHNHYDNNGNLVDAAHCGHATQGHAGFNYGKYLVSFADSVIANKFKAPYMDIDGGYTRVGFVKAIHAGDSLFILTKGFENVDPATLDTAAIVAAYKKAECENYIVNLKGDNHKNVTWSFRYVTPSNEAATTAEEGAKNEFLFESNIYTEYADAAVTGNAGKAAKGFDKAVKGSITPAYAAWLKMQNGCLVLTRGDSEFKAAKTGSDGALIFNAYQKSDDEDMVTSNDEIAAEGIAVIAGNGIVTVQGAAGKSVVITNILGKVVAETVLTSDNATIAVPAGIVAVAVEGEEAVKTIVK